MGFLNWSMAVDLVLALLILWKLLQGRSQGVVQKLGGLAALLCALWSGRFAMTTFSAQVSERWLLPLITRLLEKAKDSLGLADLLENLAGILSGSGLPAFLKTDVVDAAAQKLEEAGASAVQSAAGVVAERLAAWLLFLVAAAVVFGLVRLIFNGILDPVIRRIPIVRGVNSLLGAVLGAAVGVILAGLLLALVYKLAPGLSAPGGILAPESVEKTWVTKLYFQLLPKVFG